MSFVYADNIRLHHCNGLYQLLQQLIPFPLPFLGLPLIFFGLPLPLVGLPLPFVSLPLPFVSLPLPFVHRVHVFIYYPKHSHGQLRKALQAANSVLHPRLHRESGCVADCITTRNG